MAQIGSPGRNKTCNCSTEGARRSLSLPSLPPPRSRKKDGCLIRSGTLLARLLLPSFVLNSSRAGKKFHSYLSAHFLRKAGRRRRPALVHFFRHFSFSIVGSERRAAKVGVDRTIIGLGNTGLYTYIRRDENPGCLPSRLRGSIHFFDSMLDPFSASPPCNLLRHSDHDQFSFFYLPPPPPSSIFCPRLRSSRLPLMALDREKKKHSLPWLANPSRI